MKHIVQYEVPVTWSRGCCKNIIEGENPYKPSAVCFIKIWGISSSGRAPVLQAGGDRFESDIFHQNAQHRFMLWRDSLSFLGWMLLRPQREFYLQVGHSTNFAPLVQLDRIPGYELGGRAFESLTARQNLGCFQQNKTKLSLLAVKSKAHPVV